MPQLSSVAGIIGRNGKFDRVVVGCLSEIEVNTLLGERAVVVPRMQVQEPLAYPDPMLYNAVRAAETQCLIVLACEGVRKWPK